MGALSGGIEATLPAEISLANWMQPAHVRAALQHMSDLIPSVQISGAGDTGAPWPADPDRPPRLDVEGLDDTLARTQTDAFVVLHQGAVLHEEYRHGMAPTSRHLCMSVSKSIAGTVAGILIGDGLLDAEALVTDVVPELADTGLEGATVRHVLDMRAGTREEITTLELQRAYYATALWAPAADGLATDPDTRAHFWRLQQVREHGSDFEYRSTLTCVLAMVMERATGRTYPELLSELLWQPMGAGSDAEITVDGAGYALADIGVSCTVRDLARFGDLLRRGGRTASGREVVPESWVTDIVAPPPGLQQAFGHGSTYLDSPTGYYRDQWWVDAARTPGQRDGAYFALGIHGQVLYVDEAADVVIAKFSSWPETWDHRLASAHYRLCKDLTGAIGNRR